VTGLGSFLVVTVLLLGSVATGVAPARATSRLGADGPGGPPPVAVPPEQMEAIHRLVLACRAGVDLPYTGVQQVRVASESGDRESTVEVAHQPGSGVQLMVRPTPHSSGGTFVGQLNGPSLLPTLDEGTLARISSRYAVHGPRQGERIAGRMTDVVELVRISGAATGSVAARFWLDRSTSLPLRREVFDGTGRVQQASTFTSISYRPPPAIPRVETVVGTPPELGQGMTPEQLESLRKGGWLAPGGLPDDFDLVDARVHGTETVPEGTPPRVLQLTYTDGISVISLFEQEGRLDPDPIATWTARERGDGTVYVDSGRPERAVWSADGHVYTLVSDDPTVVEAAMSALPQPTSDPGLLERLGKGIKRVLSWLNPFG
jgi:sigma-E factor negative regulatory protein RseB